MKAAHIRILLVTLFFSFVSNAQTFEVASESGESKDTTSLFYCPMEQIATPVIGYDSLYKSLGKEIRYPKFCFEGKVYISFVVDTIGNAIDVDVIKGLNPEIDQEVLSVFKRLDFKFQPARQQGIKVKSRVIIPIHFKL